MTTDRRIISVLLLAALMPSMALAQYDLQYRGSFTLKQDLPKGFALNLGYQVRTDHLMSAFMASYWGADLNYKAHKYLTIGVEFRYGTSRQWDNFRYGIGAGTSVKLVKGLKAEAKLRYQYQHVLQQWSEIGQFPDRHQIRLKAGLSYKVHKKVELALTTEPMYAITEMVGAFRRIRTQCSVSIDLPKSFSFEIGAFHQQRLDSPKSVVIWAFTTGVSYTLPKKWWKPKKKAEK